MVPEALSNSQFPREHRIAYAVVTFYDMESCDGQRQREHAYAREHRRHRQDCAWMKTAFATAPVEDPPIPPGKPSEPPAENPPGNPRPEIPTPVRDPGEPTPPDELPGYTPEELPVHGPDVNPGPPEHPAVM